MARRRLTPAQPGYVREPETGALTPRAGLPGTHDRSAPIAQVVGQTAEAAALQDMAESLRQAREGGNLVLDVPLRDVTQGFLLRDRVGLEREALESLKASIRLHGQRVPAEVAPLPAGPGGASGGAPARRFGLISGWRRLKALEELHRETGETRFSTLRVLIRQVGEAADGYVAMVEENELREGLSYYERARLVAECTRNGVFPDEATALRQLFQGASRAKRSKIASFVDIHVHLGDLLHFPEAIPERLGLALVSRLRDGGGPALRKTLQQGRPASAAEELALLDASLRGTQTDRPARGPKPECLCPGVTLEQRRKGKTMQLVLSGVGVDDDLVARLRALLRDAAGADGLAKGDSTS